MSSIYDEFKCTRARMRELEATFPSTLDPDGGLAPTRELRRATDRFRELKERVDWATVGSDPMVAEWRRLREKREELHRVLPDAEARRDESPAADALRGVRARMREIERRDGMGAQIREIERREAEERERNERAARAAREEERERTVLLLQKNLAALDAVLAEKKRAVLRYQHLREFRERDEELISHLDATCAALKLMDARLTALERGPEARK